MSTRFAESIVEKTALAWLEGLGCTIPHNPEIAPGEPFAEKAPPLQGASDRRYYLRRGHSLAK